MIAGGAVLGFAALALLVAEKKRPLRPPTQREPGRSIANAALGAMSMAAVALIEEPMTKPLARRAARQRRGLVQRLPLPAWARDAAAVLLMDYTFTCGTSRPTKFRSCGASTLSTTSISISTRRRRCGFMPPTWLSPPPIALRRSR